MAPQQTQNKSGYHSFHNFCEFWNTVDGLVQERHNSFVNALELCISCTNPSTYTSTGNCMDQHSQIPCSYIVRLRTHFCSRTSPKIHCLTSGCRFSSVLQIIMINGGVMYRDPSVCIKQLIDHPSSFTSILTHCPIEYIDGLVQERCNSSALAMELHLSCTNPSI